MSQLTLVRPLILQIKEKKRKRKNNIQIKEKKRKRKRNNDLANLPSHDKAQEEMKKFENRK